MVERISQLVRKRVQLMRQTVRMRVGAGLSGLSEDSGYVGWLDFVQFFELI